MEGVEEGVEEGEGVGVIVGVVLDPSASLRELGADEVFWSAVTILALLFVGAAVVGAAVVGAAELSELLGVV